MSSPEKEPAVSVTQLHELRSEIETYEAFYRLYGESEVERRGFSTILSRVLHIDETEDRSIHFVIAHANVAISPIRRQYDSRGTPIHYVPYNAHDIKVVSTDGTSITEYSVLNAYGTYRAHLNSTDHQYNPIHEKVELTLMSAAEGLITAKFNMATGDGTVDRGGQPCGWILSDTESTRIREIILTPALADTLGHTAMAS